MFFLLLLLLAHVNANNVPWGKLSNPILQYSDRSIKDAYLLFDNSAGKYYAFFSSFYPNVGHTTSHVTQVASTNLTNWDIKQPILNLNGTESGFIGLCSPSVKRIPLSPSDSTLTWVLIYNSWGDKKGQPNQLFYHTSPDLVHWSERKSLASAVTKGERAIDADLTYDKVEKKWVLVYKRVQTAVVSYSTTGIDGEWHGLQNAKPKMRDGLPVLGSLENYDLFWDDQKLKVLATDIPDRHLPVIFDIEPNTHYTQWHNGTLVTDADIPKQSFNKDDRANAAAINQLGNTQGYWYMVYAGNDNHSSFSSRGHNKLGLARTTNFQQWEVLPEHSRW